MIQCNITITTIRYTFWHGAVSPSKLFATCSDTVQYHHHNCSLHVLTQCSITITTLHYEFWHSAISPSQLFATWSDSTVSPSQLFATCSDTVQYHHHNCLLHVPTQCSITITTVRYMFWQCSITNTTVRYPTVIQTVKVMFSLIYNFDFGK
jgi:hypothetical protein